MSSSPKLHMFTPHICKLPHKTIIHPRLTLAIRQFAIGESRSLLAKKKQDPSPIWLNFFFYFFIFFLGLPLVVCILFEDIRVLGLFTGRE